MKSFASVVAMLCVAVFGHAGQLQDAAGQGDIAKVRALIKNQPAAVNAREGGTTALHEATRGGHLDVVKLLVASGANVNALDFSKLTPLRLALGRRQMEIADFLRKNGGVEQIAPVPTVIPSPNAAQSRGSLFQTNASLSQRSPSSPPADTNTAAKAPPLEKPPTEREMMPVIFPIHEAARV